MPFPTTKVEISFTATPYDRDPATWVDVTTYVRAISIRRGRSGDLEQFPTGTASVLLDNRDRRFDPFNTAGPYYGDLIPRRQIRVTASTGGPYVPVFRGWVSGWPIQYSAAGFDTTTSLECFDVLGLIAEQQTLADVPAYFGYDYRRWRLNEPAGETTLLSTAGAGMTQFAGTSTYTTWQPLAEGYPYSSIRIGQGNAWRASRGVTPTFQWTSGFDLSFWMANERPGVELRAVVCPTGRGNIITILASGALQVLNYSPIDAGTITTTTTPFSNFSPHHVQISSVDDIFGPNQGQRIFIDGVDVTGPIVPVAIPTEPIRGWFQIELHNHLFQDVSMFGRNLGVITPSQPFGTKSYAQVSAEAQQNYGSAVNNVPETSRAKAERVLSRSALPAAWRSLDNNPESILGTQGADVALTIEMQKIADSEGGELFATKDGLLRLTNRSTAAANGAGTDAATFTDVGAGLRYGPELSININADEIVNRLGVTFAGGGEIDSEIAASITANGVAETSVETYLATKQGAIDFAAHQVGTFSQPIPQFSELEVSITQDLAEWATILGLELLDKFTLTVTPKTGAPITQPLIVNSINHEITPSQWVTTVQGSARYIGWFVINRSLIGGPDLLV